MNIGLAMLIASTLLQSQTTTTLEELLDPARLSDSFAPSGFMLPGQTARPVKGHEFGLKLNDTERGALIAFLRSL